MTLAQAHRMTLGRFATGDSRKLTHSPFSTVGAVMPRHGDWQLEAAGIGGVWGRGGRVHGCGA